MKSTPRYIIIKLLKITDNNNKKTKKIESFQRKMTPLPEGKKQFK